MLGLIGFFMIIGSAGALELGNIGFAQCIGQAVVGFIFIYSSIKIAELKDQVKYIKSRRG